ncbi:hypothetical protein DAPPUDRAFT_112469 [Daphnia pulex]|uniref:Fibronectin type-III domain-containing protein n=1 Tax=Daphnia pulex TaxID=6669 RepID=E9HC65_DAPPU|nr:hypothetical protein DAPPUDRAFT_119152 [Daphnia pulex]EFX70707.1 hypothetical protein DAPPUDRAFT_112469 [Daphnia pulex]|eukprot:EFX63505.1 hypothetical protein DAPPUDRAFT_119152 [Daphnia pulex]
MAVLGGQFKLGDFYDYRNDSILSDGRKCWESATRVDEKFKLKCKLPDSDSNSNKWENMGLDGHLKATVLAGLIKKYRGACNYLNDQPNPSQVVRILFLRVKSRKENFDLQTLINEDVPLYLNSGEETKKKSESAVPTHVVVGVTYGAETYCVLTQDVGKEADEDDAREEAEEKLSQIAQKMEEALNDKQELNEFKEQFDDKKQLTRVKCRLYADLQSSAVRECSVFDAYKNCLKLIDQVQQKTEPEKSKAAPIAVRLCPLKFLMGKTGVVPFEYQDVDDDLIARCGRIWDELERFGAKLDSIRTSIKKGIIRPSLRQFEDALGKYKELLKKSWKNGVVKARETGDENEIEKAAKIAETHPLFKPTRLERWLRYKQAESEMAGKMKGVSDITFFDNQKLLEKKLAESFDKKHALVGNLLSVPPLDEKTSKILADMKNYVGNYTKLTSVERDDDDTDDEDDVDDEDDDKVPWYMIPRKRKPVLEKIQELGDHVNKNKHLIDHVHFCIRPNYGSGIRCRYSVYEDGILLKDNLGQFIFNNAIFFTSNSENKGTPTKDLLVGEMKRYIGVFKSSNWTDWRSDIKGTPTKDSILTNCRRIFVAALSTLVTNNNSNNSNVQYIIFYDERIGAGVREIPPFTRLYDCRTGEAQPLNFIIPKAPGPVTVEKNYRGVITLSWTTEEEVEEPNYLLQYRKIDGSGERWDSIQHKSKEITISYLQSDETYEFRVAAVTPGGRSPFVSCEVTIDPVCPPPAGLQCLYVTDTSITISWDHQFNSGGVETVAEKDEDHYEKDEDEYDVEYYDPHDDDDNYNDEYYDYYDDDENQEAEVTISSYSIDCWMAGYRHESTFIKRSTTEKTITLEPLVPDTDYYVQVRAVCTDATGSTFYSPASQILEAKTLRDAERVHSKSKDIYLGSLISYELETITYK